MKPHKLFHISESPDIKLFNPRPSPSYYKSIDRDVVFAVSEKLLHNYILPRDCPRVTFYVKPDTTKSDKEKFFGQTIADFVIAIGKDWLPTILTTTLYIYELPAEHFLLLDETAGYYISYESAKPVSVQPVTNILIELLKRNIELRIMPSLCSLADEVSKSSLNYSIIRMCNST